MRKTRTGRTAGTGRRCWTTASVIVVVVWAAQVANAQRLWSVGGGDPRVPDGLEVVQEGVRAGLGAGAPAGLKHLAGRGTSERGPVAEESGPPRDWCGVSAAHQPPSVGDRSRVPGSIALPQADPGITYEISIFFFYTREFADDFRDNGHMEAEIAASVDLLNRAMANSSVNARFRTVGIERHPAMPAQQNRAMNWIARDERAKARRNEVGADLVYALVDDPTGYAGVACQPGSFNASTGESCFHGSVSNWTPSVRAFDNENIWRTILRHEVGHNLGIQHSPQFGGNPTGGFYPGAVGYTVTSHDPWFGTVMGGNELPRFSTSSERFDFREHKNLVVGEPGIHEASTALLHSIGPVSRYRAPAPPSFARRTTVPDQRWEEGTVIEPLMLPAAWGGDGRVTYSLSPDPPDGIVFDRSSRTLSGRPTTAAGPAEYTYTATDTVGASASLSFTIEVVEREADPPRFEPGTSVPYQRWEEGAVIEPLVLPAASGGDGGLTYSLSPDPPDGVAFDDSSLTLSGRPTTASEAVEYTYTATDAVGASASLSFTIEVVVAPPAFETGAAIPDQRWEEGTFIERLALPSASGGEGRIAYSLSPDPPDGVLFDDSSLTLSGRPIVASEATAYTYTATDAVGGSASLSFMIEVAEAEGSCRSSSSAMCFQEARYEVTVDWWTADGQSGAGLIADVGTSDSALFWFFSSTNWELLVKVLDGCAVNGHHWVFGAATTDVGYRVRVADTESGRVREYQNELGRAARAITDAAAFSEACAEAGAAASSRARDSHDPGAGLGSGHAADPSLVLQDGRFEVRVQWTTEGGETGPGSAAPERTVDSGLFWFFEPSNWEMLVKVLDGCALNEHYWVLAGSATTLGFEIAVTDTQAGIVRRYVKTDRRESAAAFVDVAAFPCGR